MDIFKEKYILKGHIACYVVFLPKKNLSMRSSSLFSHPMMEKSVSTVLVVGKSDANPPVYAHSAGNLSMKGLNPCLKLVL
jgi:hypothetical protein